MSDATTPHRGAGRPPVPAKNRRDYQVNVALSEAEMNWLRAKAKKLDMGLAAAARALMTARRAAGR